MALCPTCNARIPLKLALKSIDVLLFPEEGAEQCPACRARLIPTARSIVAAVFAFVALAACFVALRLARLSGFGHGFVTGIASGLLISLGGLFASARLLRFRTTVSGRYAWDRRAGLGILDSAPRQ